MLVRLVSAALVRRPLPALLMLASITLGTGVATAFLGSYRQVAVGLQRELRSYGANIQVEPATGVPTLSEADLPRIKTTFWKHNIVGFAPFVSRPVQVMANGRRATAPLVGTWFAKELEVPGEEVSRQGITVVAPWWEVAGAWPQGPQEAVIGTLLARQMRVMIGDTVTVSSDGRQQAFSIVGVVTAGGAEDEQLLAPLDTVQGLLQAPDRVDRVRVSALTVPMDDFGKRDPKTMSQQDYEKWYCTAYVTAVAKNLTEAMSGSRATPIWRVAAAEGAVLQRLGWLFLLLTVLALGGAIVGVAASLLVLVAARRGEIGLCKAMGADYGQVVRLLAGEIAAVTGAGVVLGYPLGVVLATLLCRRVFDLALTAPGWLFPIAVGAAAVVAVSGSLLPLRQALTEQPIRSLRN